MSDKNIKRGNKRVLAVILSSFLALFLLLSAAWLMWRDNRYKYFAEGMDRTTTSFFIPRYSYDDSEFTYYVKYPGFLSLTGNLSVTSKIGGFNSLIIWIDAVDGYEYGVIVTDETGQYQIYVDEKGEARYEEDTGVIERNREVVKLLLSKAREFWGLY